MVFAQRSDRNSFEAWIMGTCGEIAPIAGGTSCLDTERALASFISSLLTADVDGDALAVESMR